MVFRVSPGVCPGPIVGRKEDGERPKGRTLPRAGTGIPFCDYRAGRSEGKNVGTRWKGRLGRAQTATREFAWVGGGLRGLELSGGHPERTPPHPAPRPCETRGDLARLPHARDSNPGEHGRGEL